MDVIPGVVTSIIFHKRETFPLQPELGKSSVPLFAARYTIQISSPEYSQI
jgi:hypothetical protein